MIHMCKITTLLIFSFENFNIYLICLKGNHYDFNAGSSSIISKNITMIISI